MYETRSSNLQLLVNTFRFRFLESFIHRYFEIIGARSSRFPSW